MDKKGTKYNFCSIHFQWYGRLWKPVVNEAVIAFLYRFCSTILLMGLGKLEKSYYICNRKNANYKTNPQAYVITKKTVTSKSVLKLNSVAGGGFAISILAQ